MCLTEHPDYDYFHCVIDRMGKVYWLKNTMSHRDIIETYLEDNKSTDPDYITKRLTKIFRDLENFDKYLEDRDYYEVRIIPKDTKKITRNREDWEFDLLEMLISPTWYRENLDQYEENCWQCWEDSVKINLAIDNETIDVKDLFIFATGNSVVEARGKAKVVALNNATVKAYDNAKVIAYDNAKVYAHDNVRVNTNYGHVIVKAYDNSIIDASSHEEITASDNSVVKAYLHAIVRAEDNAIIEAYDNTRVEAHDNATVMAYWRSTVDAWGGIIEVYDYATVYRCWHEAKITIKSKTAVVIDNNKPGKDTGNIIVSKDAIVERI